MIPENIGNQKLSVINDPFKKTMVTMFFVHGTLLNDNWIHRGNVEFTNGNTKGSQQFTGDSFDDVVLKIKAMLDNLD